MIISIEQNGSRTRVACLEGKHDNRFTIGDSTVPYPQNNSVPCHRYPIACITVKKVVVSGSPAIPPTHLLGLLCHSFSLAPVHLCGLLVDLLHCLRVGKSDVPVTGRRWRTFPLRTMPRHRLSVCTHPRSKGPQIRLRLYARPLSCIPIVAGRCLVRDERGRRRA